MTAKKNSTPKNDKLQVNASLENLANEVSTDFEPYTFAFGGKRFVTLNPYDLDLDVTLNTDQNDIKGQLEQFLGDQFEDFMAQKPKMKHAVALIRDVEKYYGEHYGNPGESEGSQTS